MSEERLQKPGVSAFALLFRSFRTTGRVLGSWVSPAVQSQVKPDSDYGSPGGRAGSGVNAEEAGAPAPWGCDTGVKTVC